MGKRVVDGATTYNATNGNLAVYGDSATTMAMVAFSIVWTSGTSFDVRTRGAEEQENNITVTWATNKITIDLSGMDNLFTGLPVVVAGANTDDTTAAYRPQCHVVDKDTVEVRWFDSTATEAIQSTPDAKFDCDIIIIGRVA